ncbi:superoxide dismutase [Cu-Zn] 2 isoform X4 [Actinidia eriantha]|uniref:superoxide dismutase [Cu-Zn] 2 isoform X4 n=1 Tax=Actinidia eriantha TaxID=165200 RepID=UPI00258E2AF8|nr:superoxide dismutase [Cu-Zn] 2 isoform X4 [Actinidia eriantha]
MATVKAVAIVTGDPKVRGTLQFLQDPKGGTNIRGRISGLSPGLHGFHIHALGDTTNGCNSTGPHFNPLKKNHGAPSDNERHAGDLGNIVAGPDGVADISIRDMQVLDSVNWATFHFGEGSCRARGSRRSWERWTRS